MQSERMQGALVPDLSEYTRRFGLTPERVQRMSDDVIVMHPGPMNRGVEITVDPSDLARSVITQQVTTGISVRMAVLFELLGAGSPQTAMEES
jgi:aspartate carbamoyltransferase catalytic subunit